jgi:DNA polymerase delta subunit 3
MTVCPTFTPIPDSNTLIEQVERVGATRRASTPPETEDGRSQIDDDMDVDEDVDPAPKPIRKKREKKVVPVGRNGTPKRRVMKTRTATDAKGFMSELQHSIPCFL